MKKLCEITEAPKEVIRTITDHMIKIRPQSEVFYAPYKKTDIYEDMPLVGPRQIDLKKCHPYAKKGDIVYVSTVLESCCDSEANLYFEGMADVIFGGKQIYEGKADCYQNECRVFLKQGENPVTFRVYCQHDDAFVFSFMPTTTRYRMWAKYYLLNVKATSPISGFAHEDGVGISRLYHGCEEFDGVYVYPEPEVIANKIDLNIIYPDEAGTCAYAVTYAIEDTELQIKTENTHTVFVNGEKKEDKITLQKGDCVLVKIKKDDRWQFTFNDAQIGIPFLKSARKCGDKWLCTGTFDDDSDTPEQEIQFTRTYQKKNGERLFWRLAGENNYVRPYLPTRFFGQWFYALMVGSYGILQVSKAVQSAEYEAYFIKSMQVMSRYFDYMQYERELFGQPSFLELSTSLDNLDAIGTVGRNLCELYKIQPDEATKQCIQVLKKAIKENIPRFPDGTFHREHDMWADDLFMSCPFLLALGEMTENESYYQEVIHQLLGFKERLWMEKEKIFSHIYFLNTNEPNNVPWGRGNGWVYVTLSIALEKIPEHISGKQEIRDLYLAFTEGIISNQDEDGLWHQVLNRYDSYSETSCTAMFMLGLCRGIKNGYLTEEYKTFVKKAYHGLISNKITATGSVLDVCQGSGNSKDVQYYMNLGTVDDDDHGTGVVLTAISEMLKLKERENET